MWGIDPQLLCDQHLLGEHTELHQAVGTLRNHPHGEAIVRGHAERQQLDTSKLQARHDDLADELERRGMTHDSPMNYEDTHELGSINPERNRANLQNRCEDCRNRIETTETDSTNS